MAASSQSCCRWLSTLLLPFPGEEPPGLTLPGRVRSPLGQLAATARAEVPGRTPRFKVGQTPCRHSCLSRPCSASLTSFFLFLVFSGPHPQPYGSSQAELQLPAQVLIWGVGCNAAGSDGKSLLGPVEGCDLDPKYPGRLWTDTGREGQDRIAGAG